MINIKPLILELLKQTGVDVTFIFPQNTTKLPLISYYELSNIVAVKTDGKEYSSEIHLQMDIWGRTPSEVSEIVLQVDDLMSQICFVREMAVDLYESEKVHRKSMRFRGVVNNNTLFVTQ